MLSDDLQTAEKTCKELVIENNELSVKLEQQDKYAELGRLAIEVMNKKYFIQHERELNFCPVYMWDL